MPFGKCTSVVLRHNVLDKVLRKKDSKITPLAKNVITNCSQTISLILLSGKYTVSQKKQSKLFWHNFVKCPPTLIIFGTKMVNTILLCTVHTFLPTEVSHLAVVVGLSTDDPKDF